MSASESAPVSTSSRPIAMARSASSGVIAGPSVMSAVPVRTLRTDEPAAGGARRRRRDRPRDADIDDRHGRSHPGREDVDRRTARPRSSRPSARSPPTGRPRRPGPSTPWSAAATTIALRATSGVGPAGDARELDDEVLEPAEAAGRLGEAVEADARFGHRPFVEGTDELQRGEERGAVRVGGRVRATRGRGPRTRSRVRPALEPQREAGHHQVRLVGPCRDPLVGEPDEVPDRRGRRHASARSRGRPRR